MGWRSGCRGTRRQCEAICAMGNGALLTRSRYRRDIASRRPSTAGERTPSPIRRESPKHDRAGHGATSAGPADRAAETGRAILPRRSECEALHRRANNRLPPPSTSTGQACAGVQAETGSSPGLKGLRLGSLLHAFCRGGRPWPARSRATRWSTPQRVAP